MLQKFKSLSLLKKTLIIFGLVIMFFFLAPLTVKYVSAEEIDLFEMIWQLFVKFDGQETRIAELEKRIEGLETNKELEEPVVPKELEGEFRRESGEKLGEQTDSDGSILSDGGKPSSSPPEEPELSEEPESPTQVEYRIIPQRSDWGRMVYRFNNGKLYCDFYEPIPGREYHYLTWEGREEETKSDPITEELDLLDAWEKWCNEGIVPVLKGRLPENVFTNFRQEDDTLKFDLIYWYGLDAPNEVRSPRIYSHSVFSNNRIDF